eukprot:287154_1
MPMERRFMFAALAFVAVVYVYYKYKHPKRSNGKKKHTDSGPTVKTKFETKIIPLKPPRNDSFSKSLPIHYRFNYSHPQYDINDTKHQDKNIENNNKSLKIITFNVLATCYAQTNSSYKLYCSPEHLKGEHRFQQIGKLFKNYDADIICLQELDSKNETLLWMDLLNNNKYKLFYSQRTNKKQDGLLLAYKHSKYKQYNNSTLQLIKLNDLTLGCSSKNSQQYFLKDNIAIYILLQPITDPSHILFIINTHLYWHPDADNIRLRQISYLLNIINYKTNLIKQTDVQISKISLIFCGDFNTLPLTTPHDFILNGRYTMKAQGNSPLKLMMDSALNKVARWCRSLGVDCAYFSEQKLDTETANKLFKICENENRILITRSKRLVERRECPKHLLLNNDIGRDNLKQIIKYFGIEYDDDAIFTRCTLCNGLFNILNDINEINNSKQIPEHLKLNVDNQLFWKCIKCQQIYWFGEKSQTEIDKFKKVFEEAVIDIDKEAKQSKEILKTRLRKEKIKNKIENKTDNDNDEYDSDICDLDDKLKL